MEEDKKKIIVRVIIWIIILLIILALLLLKFNKKNNNTNTIQNNNGQNFNSTNSGNNTAAPRLDTGDINIDELKSSKILIKLQDCINQYYDYIDSKNATALINVLDADYIKEKSINEKNVINNVDVINEETKIFIEKAYSQMLSYDKEYKCYVYGEAYNNNLKKISNYMYIVYLNTFDKAFYIIPCGTMSESEFSIKINEVNNNTTKTSTESTRVKLNNYNKFEFSSDSELIKNIILNDFKYYNFLQVNDKNRQYMLLDENYRSKRFGGIENFNSNFQYLNMNLQYVKRSYYNDRTIYIGIDNNGKYYIVSEKTPTNFSIMLDSYTIPLSETTKKYTSSSEQQKACMCLEQVKEMINNKDYKSVYNHLNNTFKNNNFETQDKLVSYIKGKFYDLNNFEYESYQVSNNSYIITVKVIDDTDETKSFTMSFVVKLADSIEKFEMSFGI